MDRKIYETIKHKIISFVRGPRNVYLVPAAILIAAIIIALGIAVKNSGENQTYLSPQDINPEQFKPMIDFYAPLFKLKTSRGTEINLEELRGQNILLVFWAVQCQYSQQELADLKQFANVYRDKVLVLAIDYMEPAQAIKEYEQKENINFPILLDEKGEAATKYKIEGTPAHFLINKEGKISAVWPSYAPLANLEGLLQSLK
jgi:peroxiredoxin